MNNAYYITAAELAQRGFENTPDELLSAKHLIYSSPAALAFNSPGAQGFGVKRAGLAIPGSVMLLVSPGCCGRNTTMQSRLCGYQDRFFYLLLDDTDIVTGRHLTKIPEAVKELYDFCEKKPSAVMICITCVDALLGTDMKSVSKKCEQLAGVPVVPCYMYALTREKKLPPMAAVRKAVYSLLKPQKRHSDAMNIMGFFAPLNDDCEIYELLTKAGIKHIREISRCKDIEQYHKMSQANFNLVLNAEARYAAQQMEDSLGIPYIEMMRMYHIDKIHNLYMSLANALGVSFDDSEHYNKTKQAIQDFKAKYPDLNFAVGEFLNADSFELAWALISFGFGVSEIYGTVGERNFVFIKHIAKLSPETKIFSNLSPTMLDYEPSGRRIDACIGNDAGYYHAGVPTVDWNEERQPFGYAGLRLLLEKLDMALKGER